MPSQAKRIGDALRKEAANIVRDLTLQVDRNLRRSPGRGGTPVDTGHARRNWVPSVGDQFTVEVTDDAAHEAGVVRVLSYKLEDGATWLSNNVPYIDRLNYGSSSQVPAGFIERAIDEAVAKMRDKHSVVIDVDPTSIGTSYTRNQRGGDMAENMASAYSPFGDD